MASVAASPQRGGKRSLDAELNLVPFIDLLSMCICFLLMTAIWVEVGSLQIRQILGTDAAPVTQEALDLQVRFTANKGMDVILEKGGRSVQSFNIEAQEGAVQVNKLGDYVGQLMGAITTG